jgi:23S rRNA pseudouridine2457 synthase
MSDLILLNKPFGVICQFTGEGPTLADYVEVSGFYPAGRLDKDSEGLVLLTNDGKLQARISNPRYKMEKTYWVQVEGDISKDAIRQLRQGIKLKDGITLPAGANIIDPPLPERDPPVRFRASIPTSWICLTIREGKNRQIRRMTAAVGFPTLRLFRFRIGEWNITDISAGKYRTLVVDPDKN